MFIGRIIVVVGSNELFPKSSLGPAYKPFSPIQLTFLLFPNFLGIA